MLTIPEMSGRRTFSISYFSEVSVVIKMTNNDGYIRAECVHPSKFKRGRDVELLPNWFHFSHGSGVDRYDNDNNFEGDLTVQHLIEQSRRDAILDTLHVIAKELWPGPKPLMENHGVPGVNVIDNSKEAYQHFRQVVLYAYIVGKYHPANGTDQLGKRHWIDEWVNYQPN